MFEILIEHSAEKDLRKLPSESINTIIQKIKLLKENPRPSGSKKIVVLENFWRVRIGQYRVLYEINDSEKIIKVYKIKHRKDIYR
jgi:mRNA interferase RelE/StbE